MQREKNLLRIALDFQHNTVPGEPAYDAEKEPRNVAAFGTVLVVPGEGIVLDDLQWTPEGIAAYSGKHYPDISPAVVRSEDGTVVFIHSAGLVRNGAIPGLRAFSAAGDAPAAEMTLSLSAEDVRRRLGISERDWRRANPDEGVSTASAFAAASPSAAALEKWSEFARKLIELGMSPQSAMQSDYLFFDLVHAPRSSSYEREQPGHHGPGSIDIEKAQKALKDVLGLDDAAADPAEREQAGAVMEALMIFDNMLNGMWKGPGFEHVPFQPSLAEMLRASDFVSRAHSGGVYDGRERKLFELFFEYRNPRRSAG